MTNSRSRLLLLALPLAAAMSHAQTDAREMHREAEFQQREVTLLENARKNESGEDDVALPASPTQKLLLVASTKTGEAEIRKVWTDEVVIRTGEATVVVGGSRAAPFPLRNGGRRVSRSIDQWAGEGNSSSCRDVLHIPPNVPYWMKLNPGSTATYIIFKAR